MSILYRRNIWTSLVQMFKFSIVFSYTIFYFENQIEPLNKFKQLKFSQMNANTILKSHKRLLFSAWTDKVIDAYMLKLQYFI